MKLFRAVVGIAFLSLGLTGCNLDQHPAYSANVKYGLRTDPIIKVAKELGDERFEPDRPGLLPILKIEDMRNPDHPYYARHDKLDDKFIRDPRAVPAKERKELEDYLEKVFGTPAAPKVDGKEAGIDEATIKDLKLDEATLAKGSIRYRIHCLHCHGVPGDGRGPTARWINPHPRDFRGGMFKFSSVDRTSDAGRPPSRADLLRTLREGIEGTAMPSFRLLSDEDLDSLISYVMHLSIRGKVELTMIKDNFEPDKASPGALMWATTAEGDIKENVQFFTKKFAAGWADANKPANAIKVAKYHLDERAPDYMDKLKISVKRGQEMFDGKPSPEFRKFHFDRLKKGDMKDADDKAIEARVESTLTGAKCVTCHIDYGRQAKFKYDEWGTLVKPNNLTLGVLRGGKRPVDIYYRVHSGISGSEMTPFGRTPFQGNEDYLWDVVNFVTILPYPHMREQMGIKID